MKYFIIPPRKMKSSFKILIMDMASALASPDFCFLGMYTEPMF